MKKRKYTLKHRAEQKNATRDRIVRATMELHEEKGPRNTSISAIAERAGVQRLTVYRHFENDEAIFQACTALWLEEHPPPDTADWGDIEDHWQRIVTAFNRMYRYYQDTRQMWEVSYRDAAEVPALQAPMAAFANYLRAVAKSLLIGNLSKSQKAHFEDTLLHCLGYTTWKSLDHLGISDTKKVKLVTRWLRGTVVQDQ